MDTPIPSSTFPKKYTYKFAVMKVDPYNLFESYILKVYDKVNHAILDLKKRGRNGEVVEIHVMDAYSEKWAMDRRPLAATYGLNKNNQYKILKHYLIGEIWINLLWPSLSEDTLAMKEKEKPHRSTLKDFENTANGFAALERAVEQTQARLSGLAPKN